MSDNTPDVRAYFSAVRLPSYSGGDITYMIRLQLSATNEWKHSKYAFNGLNYDWYYDAKDEKVFGGQVRYRDMNYVEESEARQMYTTISKVNKRLRTFSEKTGATEQHLLLQEFAKATGVTEVEVRRTSIPHGMADALFGPDTFTRTFKPTELARLGAMAQTLIQLQHKEEV
jgi:hypothetical protein